MPSSYIPFWLTAFLLLAIPSAALACTAADFAAAVDNSAAALRKYTAVTQPKLQERLQRYREVKNLSESDYENAALDAIQDARLEALDSRSSDLLMKIDSLGRIPEGTKPDCAKLDEINAASGELLAVIKQKSDYMLERLDQKIAEASPEGGPKAPAPVAAAPPAKKIEKKDKDAKERPTAAKPKSAPAAEAPKAQDQDWAANTTHQDAYTGGGAAQPAMPHATDLPGGEDGYSIEEIREATRGFFGTISTNLASVIEHAFKQSGRPTAYVLGTEGGGAFLAGLRFGEGRLFMRTMPGTRQVYWHGPSLGTDFGASGSRTMFLIYRMHNPDALFRHFTGVDGSAYFVGGVGFTLLKGGEVLMAPIRSGIGLRLGANVGYLRFTEKPTWNPF